jgi:hypothetical protein
LLITWIANSFLAFHGASAADKSVLEAEIKSRSIWHFGASQRTNNIPNFSPTGFPLYKARLHCLSISSSEQSITII